MKTQFILFLAFFFCNNLWSQQDTISQRLYSFVKNINTFNHLYPQEKVYLHFDNTGYFLGETIWFKAYNVTASDLKLSSLSKVLYTEILTPEGKILESKKLKLKNGQAHGEFILKDSLYAGFYEVRAYTKSMLNFGKDVIFSRVFPVFDVPKQEGDYTKQTMNLRPKNKRVENLRNTFPKLNKLNILFFPEGGNLIAGVNNKVAFKILGEKGEAINTSGEIRNSEGTLITTFSTIHEGMGSFILYPDGQKYTAIVEYEGNIQKISLPPSLSEGYSLQVNNNQKDNLIVKIAGSTNIKLEPLGITFICRGKPYVFDILEFNNNEPVTLSIPKEKLPSGVIQITLFNNKGQILGERLAFINHASNTTEIKSEIKTDYKPLSPVRIDFVSPTETSFSIAVRDGDMNTYTNYTDNMQTNFLLTSDLKGYINNPAYYFEKDDAEHRLALDLLLMTQGWRRYEWTQIAGIEKPNMKYGIEKGLIIEGQIVSVARKIEKTDIDVSLKIYYPNGSTQEGDCLTDNNGRFNFLLQDYYGKADMTLSTRKKGKLEYTRVLLDRQFSPKPYYYDYNQTIVFKKIENSQVSNQILLPSEQDSTEVVLTQHDNTMSHTLSEVTVTEKKKWKQENEGLEKASVVYNINEELDEIRDKGDAEYDNVLDFLEKKNNDFTYSYTEMSDLISVAVRYKSRSVIFIINNMLAKVAPIETMSAEDFNNFDKDNPINNFVKYSLSDFSIDQIKNVMIVEDSGIALRYNIPREAILKGDFYAIYIYTKDRISVPKQKKGFRDTSFQGYSNVKQFISPDYSQVVLPNEKDFRRTLYWNPHVKTDKKGKASINFYNSQNAKKIIIDAEDTIGKEVDNLLE